MTDLIAMALQAPFRTFEEAEELLHDTALKSGVKHLSYWYLNLDSEGRDDVIWLATYDPAYMSLYMREYTPMGDPVMGTLLADTTYVIDWMESVKSSAIARRMYQTAFKYGTGRNGISFSFRDKAGGTVIFSVSSELDNASWPEQRQILVDRFEPFAHSFHERAQPLIRLVQQDQSQLSLVA
jgi:hypothetical protein